MKSRHLIIGTLAPLVSSSLCFADIKGKTDEAIAETEEASPAGADETGPNETGDEPEVPSSKEKSVLAKDIVQKNFSSIAIIEGDAGSGTGFIINEGDATRLYTAAHVIAGNKRLTVKNSDGRKFSKFGTFEVAGNSDLARIQLLEDFKSDITIAKHGTAKVSAPLLAIGNSGGAGVLTVIEGQAKALGPDSIEVSNQVIQGNSGGPIFSGETGELLGLVTHATAAREDIWAEGTEFEEVRRFATRLDRPIKWRTMKIGSFLQETERMETFNRNTRILYAISALHPTQEGLRLDTRVSESGPTILSIIEENKDVPAVSQLLDMNIELGDKRMRISENDLKKRFSRYYGGALLELNKDSKNFMPTSFSGYRQAEAKQALEWRTDAVNRVESATNNLR
ncbi:serine protease [Haloferula chungangensis]|uniref:Serine protease n=1 Tax=Haloferula chungangensis TaxID=1048331 RepID=A0ABW2L7P7_9BACT